MDPYISALYEIVSKGSNTNSYKFALWRALASLAPSTNVNNPNVSKRDLSPLFVKYYWPLEVKYHIRQGIDPTKDPIVMTAIRRLLAKGKINSGESVEQFQRRMPEDYEELLYVTARKAFEYVIPCFHTVRSAPTRVEIFKYTGKAGNVGDTIELTKGGRKFLIDYQKLVDYVAISGWVRFTEGFTSAPKLHDKIEGTKLKRGAVAKWCSPLMAIQDGRCFYNKEHVMDAPEVDHVLPWSFVVEDKTWNLVAACRNCNNAKRDKLPSTNALDRLCNRNEKIGEERINVPPDFVRHFAEWSSRDLSRHIRGLHDQAAVDGFPPWL